MEDNFDKLKNVWQAAKVSQSELKTEKEMLNIAMQTHKKTKKSHRLNIIILTITCFVMAIFLVKVLQLKFVLSDIGIGLMLGSLLLRIIIEVISQIKTNKIEYSFNTLDLTDNAISFYNWRKKVHGTITILIIIMYTTGFYFLTPEFLKLYSLGVVALIDGGYLVMAIILFFAIRKGVLNEMDYLKRLTEINSDIKLN